MSTHNITIEGGTSKRLLTAGKYCDRDIVVTATGGGETSDPTSFFQFVKNVELADLDVFNTTDLVVNSEVLNDLTNFASGATNTKVKTITFNTPTFTNINRAFYNQKLIEELDFENGASVQTAISAFANCTALKNIKGDIVINTFSNTFNGCTSLEQVTFVGESITNDISFANSPNLTENGLSGIYQGLKTLSEAGSKTLTLHQTAYNLLNEQLQTTLNGITNTKKWAIAIA